MAHDVEIWQCSRNKLNIENVLSSAVSINLDEITKIVTYNDNIFFL